MRLIRENYIDPAKPEFFVDDASLLFNPGVGTPYEPGYVPPYMSGTPDGVISYPASNVVDLHPKKVAKSVSYKTVLSFLMSEPSSGLAIFNTNARYVRIEILDIDGNLTNAYSFFRDLKGARTYEQLITDRNKPDLRELMVVYPTISGYHIINIYLEESSAIEVGVVFAGLYDQFANPDLGLTQSFRDYSIVSELATGATYTLKRDMVRTYAFTSDMCESAGKPGKLKDIFLEIGPNPIPWLISDDDEEMWLVFARKDTEPSGNFYAFNRVSVAINLIEVL